MKVLFIGGSGNISASCVRLCVARGMDVFVLNRGQRAADLAGAHALVADAKDPAALAAAVAGHNFDAVADFVAFTPEDVLRDAAVFAGRTRQYLFISSASCYQKPTPHPFVTESTPLKNPVWEYSRNKIACEERLTALWREHDFPMVIVRPSLTYATVWPIAIGGWDDFTLVSRMRRGRRGDRARRRHVAVDGDPRGRLREGLRGAARQHGRRSATRSTSPPTRC